jgi:hypothetical protein
MADDYLTRGEVQDISRVIAKESVTQVLKTLGINPDDVTEVQKDMAWMRSSRNMSEKVTARMILTAVTLMVSGVAAAVVSAFHHGGK